MRLSVKRYWIAIVPENETDEAYLETVLGLANDGPGAVVKRENVIGMSAFAYVRVERAPAPPPGAKEGDHG